VISDIGKDISVTVVKICQGLVGWLEDEVRIQTTLVYRTHSVPSSQKAEVALATRPEKLKVAT